MVTSTSKSKECSGEGARPSLQHETLAPFTEAEASQRTPSDYARRDLAILSGTDGCKLTMRCRPSYLSVFF
jgi:hypothetical protein